MPFQNTLDSFQERTATQSLEDLTQRSLVDVSSKRMISKRLMIDSRAPSKFHLFNQEFIILVLQMSKEISIKLDQISSEDMVRPLCLPLIQH